MAVRDKELVESAIAELQDAGVHPAPFKVHRLMANKHDKWLGPDSIRGIVRRARTAAAPIKLRGNRRRGKSVYRPQLPIAEFEEYVAANSNITSGSVCFLGPSIGTVITSFILLLPPFFDALAAINDIRPLGAQLVGFADTTFNCEWNGYVFAAIGVTMWRMILGRWRRTPWPLAYVCSPREDRPTYKGGFEEVQAELGRRRLPRILQMHLDYFAGVGA
jgi:hypothetical protein